MIEEKNIKSYSNYLWTFIIVNLSIYLCITLKKNIDFNNVNSVYKNLCIKDGIIATASAFITFILNGIISPNLKAILVFWRIKNPLPGCRVFTKLINNDYRINRSDFIKKYGDLPTEPQAQNQLWYKIYKTNEFHPMIFDSHKNFLISRDLTALSFLFLIIYTVAIIITDVIISTKLAYLCFLIIQYVIMALVSQHHGNRFTCNCLAVTYVNKDNSTSI